MNNFHWHIGSLTGLLQSGKLVSLTFLRSEIRNLVNLRYSGPFDNKFVSQVLLGKVIVVRLLVTAHGCFCFYPAFSRDNRPRTKIQWFILKCYRGVFGACDNIFMIYKSQLIISQSSKFGLINFLIGYMKFKTLIFHPFWVWFCCKSLFSFTWIFLNDGKLIFVFSANDRLISIAHPINILSESLHPQNKYDPLDINWHYIFFILPISFFNA